jgi:DNA-directed RNA polymerase II subunit RPB3
MSGKELGSRTPKVSVLKYREDKVKFELTGTDTSVANAFRRVVMAEVNTLTLRLFESSGTVCRTAGAHHGNRFGHDIR